MKLQLQSAGTISATDNYSFISVKICACRILIGCNRPLEEVITGKIDRIKELLPQNWLHILRLDQEHNGE